MLHERIDRSILGQAAVRASIAVAAVLVAAVLLVGCASKSLSTKNETMPPIVVATLSEAGIKDLRHPYRAAVCGQLPTGSRRNTGTRPSRLSEATLFSVTRKGSRACTDDFLLFILP